MAGDLQTLREVKIRDIDIEEARRHFDLPVEEQFESRRALVSGLSATKQEFLGLFKGQETIRIWRAMDCDTDWVSNLSLGDEVGVSWSWGADGAVRGSGIDRVGAGIILEAEVHESEIDWPTTIAVGTFHEDEKEIVVPDSSAVVLRRVTQWPSGQVIRQFEDDEARVEGKVFGARL